MKRTLLIVLPPAVILLVAFAAYGTAGPPDTVRANALFRLLGMIYGVYVVALIYVWLKRRDSQCPPHPVAYSQQPGKLPQFMGESYGSSECRTDSSFSPAIAGNRCMCM